MANWDKIEGSPFTVENGKIEFNTNKLGKYALKKKPSILVLYDEGDECTAVSGGWRQFIRASVTKEDTYIRIYYNYYDYNNQIGGACTTNKIDYTDFNTLHVIACEEPGGSYGYPDIGIGIASNPDSESGRIGLLSFQSSEGTIEKSIDISNLSGSGHFYIMGTYNMKSANYGRLYKMWLE